MNTNTKTKKDHDLFRQFLQYVPLNVLGMLALSCYILADTFFVANGVGADGLTALNLVLPVYSFISGLGLLFGMGGATKYAIYRGADKAREADRTFTLTMVLCAATGAAITAIGAFFARDICVLLGADSAILPMAEEYLRTIMLFAIAFIVNNALVCFVRNDGSPQLSMLAMVTGSLSNVVLDYIFVFPLGLGMFGAAIATCLAPIIGILTLSLHLFSHKSKLKLVGGWLSLRRTGKIVSIGFSAFVTEFSTGLVMLIFNFIILSIAGNTGVAAYGVVANLNLFAVAIFAGISEGVQPLISSTYGSRNTAALKKIFRWAVTLSVAIGVILYIVIFFFAEPIAGVFNRDNNTELTRLAVEGMRLYFPLLLLSGVNIVAAALFASISKASSSFLISVSRAVVLVTVLVFALSSLWGMAGVWLTMPCTELLTFSLTLFLLKRLMASDFMAEEVSGEADAQTGIGGLIITISREYGSGGRLIGEQVAKALGVAFYDRKLIDLTARQSGLAEEYIGQWEEQSSSRFIWAPVTSGLSAGSAVMQGYYSNQDKMYFTQSKIMKELAQKGPCVIVGRCADRILQGHEKRLDIFIHADAESRTARIIGEYGESAETADDAVKHADHGRANYYQHYTGARWGDKENYHLMIDSGKFGVAGAAALIISAAQSSFI